MFKQMKFVPENSLIQNYMFIKKSTVSNTEMRKSKFCLITVMITVVL